ncbi:hypothetical protein FACS189459_1560 [Bacilli bacterium]|nr:hypothetical protein FACS189459_1560 [Bacilli bacterium]
MKSQFKYNIICCERRKNMSPNSRASQEKKGKIGIVPQKNGADRLSTGADRLSSFPTKK